MRPMTLVLLLFTALAADAADIDSIVADCDACHGKNGVSQRPTVPTIAGISAFAHEDYLLVYRDNARPCANVDYCGDAERAATNMCKVAAGLSDDQIAAVAAHYAKLPFKAAQQDFDPAKAAAGRKLHAQHCDKCHSKGGANPDDDASILAGQWMAYLEASFAEYRGGEREQPKNMKTKLDALSDADVDALVHYYASLGATAR